MSSYPADVHIVGVVSDTHGLLRAGVIRAFDGVDLIIHAGDVGSPDILEGLRETAPVVAVRGNMDREPVFRELPEAEAVKVAGATLYVIHDVGGLDLDPAAAGFRAVISGHSHRPSVVERDGVLYVNPGSAGPRRFWLPVSLAILEIQDGCVDVRLANVQT